MLSQEEKKILMLLAERNPPEKKELWKGRLPKNSIHLWCWTTEDHFCFICCSSFSLDLTDDEKELDQHGRQHLKGLENFL